MFQQKMMNDATCSQLENQSCSHLIVIIPDTLIARTVVNRNTRGAFRAPIICAFSLSFACLLNVSASLPGSPAPPYLERDTDDARRFSFEPRFSQYGDYAFGDMHTVPLLLRNTLYQCLLREHAPNIVHCRHSELCAARNEPNMYGWRFFFLHRMPSDDNTNPRSEQVHSRFKD